MRTAGKRVLVLVLAANGASRAPLHDDRLSAQAYSGVYYLHLTCTCSGLRRREPRRSALNANGPEIHGSLKAICWMHQSCGVPYLSSTTVDAQPMDTPIERSGQDRIKGTAHTIIMASFEAFSLTLKYQRYPLRTNVTLTDVPFRALNRDLPVAFASHPKKKGSWWRHNAHDLSR